MTMFGQIFELDAVTLTQVHIGDGTTLGPENYKLESEGRDLIYFDPGAVIARLSPSDRKRFISKATQSDPRTINEAFRILWQAVKGDLVLDRIAVSQPAREEFKKIIEAPDQRRGDIYPFQRTGGHPVIPGSSIKGALRTALLSRLAAPKLEDLRNRYKINDGRYTSELWRNIEMELLELRAEQDTTADPFRFLEVSDALLSGVQSRYEKVVNIGRGKEKGMKMIYECIPPGTRFKITLRIDVERAHAILKRDLNKGARHPLTPEEVFEAANEFFTRRWEHEKKKFFENENGFQLPKNKENWVLLRIGRFSHFESASLEGLRKGLQRQNNRLIEEGSTRMVVRDGGRCLPFGWILLARPGAALPAELPTLSTPAGARASSLAASSGASAGGVHSSSASSSASPSRTAGSLEGQRGYYYREEVCVVRDDGEKLIIRYVDSDDEEEIKIDKKELKKK